MAFEKFGANVQHRMLDKNLNKINLAKKVGVTPSAISKICHNKRDPSCKLALKIADALGTTVDDLVKGDVEYATRKSKLSRHH